MYFIGIDLSGPSNFKETAVVSFNTSQRGYLSAHKSLLGADDNDILYFAYSLKSAGNIVVGIDAPLSYNVGGGDRASDADLRKKIISSGLRSGSVMSPTMNRMVYLTLRGISIARLLIAIDEKIKIVEVHPGATMALRGAAINAVVAFKNNKKSRWDLLAWLEKQGLKKAANIKDPTDHYVAACASALAAWKWYQNESVWLHPAEQPLHPFDYAC
jgi:predicted nuclease with RNAse H fold